MGIGAIIGIVIPIVFCLIICSIVCLAEKDKESVITEVYVDGEIVEE
jgi:hypothetical protein